MRQAQGRVTRFQPLWVTNAISVTATASVIDEIAARSEVARITADAIDLVPVGPPTAPPSASVAQIGAATAWVQGFDGQGIVIASLDTGVDVTHPDLAGTWRGGSNSWFDPYGQHLNPTDRSGHGTATMGAIVGGEATGIGIGVAPGASWIAARIFDDGGGSTATAVHSAMQWLFNPDGNLATTDAPLIVNNSWAFGTAGCNLEFQPDLQALRTAGIVPVFAAANYGPGAATGASPANYPEALAVGATDNADHLYPYSSRGPSACGESSTTYPDVVAPGTDVLTTDLYGSYQYWSGTSLAASSVTGALALLLSSGRASTATAEAALRATAVDLGAAGADDLFGGGRIDVAAALSSLTAPPPPPPHDDDDDQHHQHYDDHHASADHDDDGSIDHHHQHHDDRPPPPPAPRRRRLRRPPRRRSRRPRRRCHRLREGSSPTASSPAPWRRGV